MKRSKYRLKRFSPLRQRLAASLFMCFAVALTVLPNHVARAEKGGSSGWRNWNEWEWEQPDFDELSVKFTFSNIPLGLIVDFVSVWDERFQQYANGADGFLVFHVASEYDLQNILLEADSPDGMNVLGGESYGIEILQAGIVKSLFVPIKAPGKTGEFDFIINLHHAESNTTIQERIVVIKNHRRNIYSLSLGEYLNMKREARLADAEKRPGAEFYRPSDYCEPATLFEDAVVLEPNPRIEGYSEYLANVEVPPGGSSEIEDHPEWFMDVEYPEVNSVHYYFEGTIGYTEAYSNLPKSVSNARVWIYDDDSGECIQIGNICIPTFTPDDVICSAYTARDGTFWCEGEAEDLDGTDPDPYVVVFPKNTAVKVKDCIPDPDQWIGVVYMSPFMWTRISDNVVLPGHNDVPSGSYRIGGTIDVGSPNELCRRQYMAFDHINIALWRNIQAWRDAVDPETSYPWLGEYVGCVHSENNMGSYCDYFFDEIMLYQDDATSPSIVAHEFGHLLHHKLIGQAPPGPWLDHTICEFPQNKMLAFSEGFADAMSLYVYDLPYYCTGSTTVTGLPWRAPASCSHGNGKCCGDGFEGSHAHFAYDKWYCQDLASGLVKECYFRKMKDWLSTSGNTVKDFPYGWHRSACKRQFEEAVWEGVQQALCIEYVTGSEFCPVFKEVDWQTSFVLDEVINLGGFDVDYARSGKNEYMIAAALWDLYDGSGKNGPDETCEHHFWSVGRDTCDTWYGNRDPASWGQILKTIKDHEPDNYYEFIEALYQTLESQVPEGEQWNSCEVRNYLRNISRFNGITLRGVFDEFWQDWGNCDKWDLTPEQEPPPCAATQAVVSAVEEGIDGVSMTEEEGEILLQKIRTIRDEFLLDTTRGQYYAYMYSTCSEEIIEGILENPQVTLTALALMEDAAIKLENIEYYFTSTDSPIDENFVALATSILEELASHTSPEMLANIGFIEADLEMVQGMTIQELLDYFENSP